MKSRKIKTEPAVCRHSCQELFLPFDWAILPYELYLHLFKMLSSAMVTMVSRGRVEMYFYCRVQLLVLDTVK